MSSSGYRMRISTARMFGLIDLDWSGAIKLTALGLRVVDEGQAKKAKVEAFLNVPLYRKLHDELRGKVVPPPAALERLIATLGVSPKQTDRARQALERSAQSAGFFDKGRDRLVAPFSDAAEQPIQEVKKAVSEQVGVKAKHAHIFVERGGDASGKEPPSERHALIEALVDVLPRPGKVFDIEDLADWLRAAEINLRLIYKLKGHITINVEDRNIKTQ